MTNADGITIAIKKRKNLMGDLNFFFVLFWGQTFLWRGCQKWRGVIYWFCGNFLLFVFFLFHWIGQVGPIQWKRKRKVLITFIEVFKLSYHTVWKGGLGKKSSIYRRNCPSTEEIHILSFAFTKQIKVCWNYGVRSWLF